MRMHLTLCRYDDIELSFLQTLRSVNGEERLRRDLITAGLKPGHVSRIISACYE